MKYEDIKEIANVNLLMQDPGPPSTPPELPPESDPEDEGSNH